jgi:phospholipid transport system substrate-binding protein
MFNKRLKFVSVALVLTLFAESLSANAKEISERFLDRANSVVSIVKDKSLSADVRNDKIIETIDPLFDFRLMAKLSLGKKHWRSLSDAKQEEFTKLYVKRMKDSYSKKIDAYTDEKIVVTKSINSKKNRVVIVTELVGSDDKTEVIYKYHRLRKPIANKDAWLVYDAIISGVSIIKTDRSQFKEVLRENSIDVLMDRMRNSKK